MTKYQSMTTEERKAAAQEIRAAAAENYKRKEESFQRCDTDGFLSQWASGITGNLKQTEADLLENDLQSEFDGLYEGDRRVKAKPITTQYGMCWVLHDDETNLIKRRGKPFIPYAPTYRNAKSRVHKELGLSQRQETDQAWCCIEGSGTGLAGAASCYIKRYRIGDKWGADATLIEGGE
jgi:hypothetical protein